MKNRSQRYMDLGVAARLAASSRHAFNASRSFAYTACSDQIFPSNANLR